MNEQNMKKRGRPKKNKEIKEDVKEDVKEEEKKAPDPIEDEGLTDKKMNSILLELKNTYFWTAIKRFLDMQYIKVRDGLMSIDPVSNPTNIARQQGTIGGIVLLESYINQLQYEIDLEKDEKDGKNKFPSYN